MTLALGTKNNYQPTIHNESNGKMNNLIGADGSKSAKSALGLNTDFSQFILMLTTQLKYQDPTEPLDTNQFTQQIVAFTGVEQAVATNSNLEKLIELNQGVQFNHASGLVGKEIKYDASTIDHKMGDYADFSYSLEPTDDQEVAHTSIKVIDSNGIIVKTLEGGNLKGINNVHWNGIDERNKKSPSGSYTIHVQATDQNGMPVKVGNSIFSGQVREAEISNGQVLLNVNGTKIGVNQVKSIQNLSHQ